MGLHHALKLGAHQLRLGGLDGDPGAAAPSRHRRHVEAAARSRDDGREAAAIRGGCLMRAQKFAAPAVLEQLDPALDHLGEILDFDGARIGFVGESELAGLVACPHRRDDRCDQGAQGGRILDVLVVPSCEFGQLGFDAADLA